MHVLLLAFITITFLSACGGAPAGIEDRQHPLQDDEYGDRQHLPQGGREVGDRQQSGGDQHLAVALSQWRSALGDVDPAVRVQAVVELADLQEESSADLLAYAFIDPNVSVRMEAVEAIGRVGGDQALSLLSIALSDSQEEVREAAVAACANIGGDEAAMVLTTALADEVLTVREEALYSLQQIGGSLAEGLIQQALSDEDAGIREVAQRLSLQSVRSSNR